MEAIYEVIKSVSVYLILVTVLLNLVSGSTYKKYVQLVCGMILILIVLMPVMNLLSLGDDLGYQFHLSDFEIKMREDGVFKEAEEVQQKKIEEAYKRLLKDKIAVIVERHGSYVEKTEIVLAEDDYGVIEEIVIQISEIEAAEEIEDRGLENGIKVVEPVEIDISMEEVLQEPIMEKNKVTEEIRKEIASEFAMKEERIIVYQEEG